MSTAVIDQEQVSTFTITKEISARAPIELAFEAVLEEVGPGLQTPDGRSLQMKLEAWPGGRWYRDLGNNAGHLWGHVQVIKPPTLLELCGPIPMSYPALNHIQYRLTAEGGKTHIKLVHRAMGLILPEHRDGMPEGWEHELERIRERAERKAAESNTTSRGAN